MNEVEKRLWIIPGPGLEENSLIDGEPIFYEFEIGKRDHGVLLEKFCNDYKIERGICSSHNDYGQLLTNLGIAFFINVGKINEKWCGCFYFPKQLSEKQIEFFEQRRDFFKEYFHENISFFGVSILPDTPLTYSSTAGFRNLEIESIIEGNPSKNGQELMFKELERQRKELLGEKHL